MQRQIYSLVITTIQFLIRLWELRYPLTPELSATEIAGTMIFSVAIKGKSSHTYRFSAFLFVVLSLLQYTVPDAQHGAV